MAKIAGSLWIEGATLHFVADDLSEWSYAGDVIASGVAGLPGSLWVDGDYLYYIDASSVERRIPNVLIKTTTGLAGSIWIDAQRLLSYLAPDRSHHQAHGDVPHSD